MTVGEALQQSRAAHVRYREALPRRMAAGATTVAVPGDAALAGAALVEACRWRAEAHVLDPSRTDPAWTDEALTHDHGALLDFYVDQLMREPVIIQAETPAVAEVVAGAEQALAPPAEPVVTADGASA